MFGREPNLINIFRVSGIAFHMQRQQLTHAGLQCFLADETKLIIIEFTGVGECNLNPVIGGF